MAGTGGVDRLAAAFAPPRRRLPASRAVSGWTSRFARQAAGAPRHGRLDRLRAGRRLVLLLADRDGRHRLGAPRRRARWPSPATAWFDHQWGDFISVGGGGWDWFAVNLDDGTDLTLSLVRDADGSYPLVYGTLVDADGATRHLDRDALSVETGTTLDESRDRRHLPGGWTIAVPGEGLVIDLEPTVADQELDTRATTGRHLLGGVAGRHARRAMATRSAARPTWS